MSDTVVQHGWYSKKAAELLSQGSTRYTYEINSTRQYAARLTNIPPTGGSIYATPDGGEVTVTNITDDATDSGCGWEDVVYAGEVTNWLRDAPLPLV